MQTYDSLKCILHCAHLLDTPKTLRRVAVCLLTVTLAATAASAQSEAGLLVEAGAEKKLNKQWSLSLDADLRTRNNLRTMDRWSVGFGAEYKPAKYLKLGAGYTLLNSNDREDISYHSDGSYNNWRPSYWGLKHRFNVSATGTYKFQNNLRISLRERWQYTYRPEQTVDRWDFDNACWQDKVRSGKGKNQLRSRLQIEYDKKRALVTPYANVELYNSWAVEKIRYTVGADFDLTKQHRLGIFYRFQDMRQVDADDYDPDMHYIGIGYKFKF
jgi:long-subunit fatty acid transport protein